MANTDNEVTEKFEAELINYAQSKAKELSEKYTSAKDQKIIINIMLSTLKEQHYAAIEDLKMASEHHTVELEYLSS